jgi:8-oxo-dGTP pyrophosphatase MutT (NUDIX family)
MRECVFLWFYAVECNKVYLLLQHRADGMFGTAGGKLEKDESLIDAMYREVKEEINVDVKDRYVINPLTTFVSGSGIYSINSYITETSLSDLRQIQLTYHNATHANEVAGMSIIEFNDNTVKHLMQYPFAGRSTSEIIALITFFTNLEK